MGFGGISVWSLLLILAIVVLLFGTKKLRNVGSDLGGAIKSFKKAVKDEDSGKSEVEQKEHNVIEGEVSKDREKVS